MLGAIAGDIIGSVYEWQPIKTVEFPLFSPGCRFTDDSVLTVAVARAILEGTDYLEPVRELGRRYPDAGYGGSFRRWLQTPDPAPYNSWGNGSAMRVSPVGFAFDDPARVLDEARRSAVITHDHPEGIKGAQAVALTICLARQGVRKAIIRREIELRFGYDLSRNLDQIRPAYRFDVSCKGSVPEALIAFFEAEDFESAVRLAVSLGGDSDTQACIAGAVAEAFYGGVPESIAARALELLPPDLREVTERFCRRFGCGMARD